MSASSGSGRTRTDPELEGAVLSGADFLQAESDTQLEGWRASERALFEELMQDAKSALQREMLLRVVAAKHTPAEVHAFADEIRGLDDAQLYAVCTVDASVQGRRGSPSHAANMTVAQRLRAQADPLYAFELQGRRLSPRLEDDPGPAYEAEGGRPRPRFPAPPALFVGGRGGESFENSLARGKPLRSRELGASRDEPSFKRASRSPSGPASAAPSATEDEATATGMGPSARGNGQGLLGRLNDAVAGLGLTFRDEPVDAGKLTLEKALELAARALEGGAVVPVALGRKAGESGRQVLLLQAVTSPAKKTRAFQLHDPFSGETVWANERDLLARSELPFAAKQWRRITRVYLPVAPRAEGK